MENIVHEGLTRIKPIALSRLPELTVKAGTKANADLLTKVLNTDIKKRKTRKVLGRAHKEEPINFYSVIKARWNEELGTDGDYEFVNVHADSIKWDHTCKTNDADEMFFVAEAAEFTVKEILMMFPSKEKEFLDAIGFSDEDRKDQKKMASKYQIWEVWFHWYKDHRDEATGEIKWEKVNAVVWKYKKCVLGKMRNPYFDYEGQLNLFTKAKKERREPNEQELFEAMFGNPEGQRVYNNYFKRARKPYYFMVYESMGDDPIDATTRVEQVLRFQDHINLEGLQISEMNARTVGKPVISSQLIKKEDARKIDWKDHNSAVMVNTEDVRKAFVHIPGIPAPSQLYKSKQDNRSIAFEILGVNATTRGLRENDSTLGQDQMAREADYGLIDDIVEETINECAEWMAGWSMQFIKLFYTKEHFRDVIGKDGESLYLAITQDIVEDGMIAEVSASGVDKLMRKRMAVENMNAGVSDPLSYYEDTEQSNPKERARRAMLFKTAPQLYYQEYLAVEGGVSPFVQPPPGIVPPPASGASGETPPQTAVV